MAWPPPSAATTRRSSTGRKIPAITCITPTAPLADEPPCVLARRASVPWRGTSMDGVHVGASRAVLQSMIAGIAEELVPPCKPRSRPVSQLLQRGGNYGWARRGWRIHAMRRARQHGQHARQRELEPFQIKRHGSCFQMHAASSSGVLSRLSAPAFAFALAARAGASAGLPVLSPHYTPRVGHLLPNAKPRFTLMRGFIASRKTRDLVTTQSTYGSIKLNRKRCNKTQTHAEVLLDIK